jgi:phosphatidylinositol alpha-1,6-mannosyltransferase
VDTDRFTPGEVDPQYLARQGLTGKKLVLTVGRLVPRKGIDIAIRAMKLVVSKLPNTHHLIVGDGDYKSELERIIHEEHLGDYVTLVGKTTDEDLLNYLRCCDVFLMPNRTMPDGDTEGFGLVFREANACAKPVIGGRAGGAVEAVVDGRSGFLVDGNDPNDVARTLMKLLLDDSLCDSMGQMGYILAQENDTRAVAARFNRVCERLLRVVV